MSVGWGLSEYVVSIEVAQPQHGVVGREPDGAYICC